MARLYVVTEEEMMSLIESMELQKLREMKDFQPYKSLDAEWRHLTENERKNMEEAIDSIHRRFHMATVRWAQAVGFQGYRK